MKKRKSLDLHAIIGLAVQNMYSSLDERRDYLPFFTYRLFNTPIHVEHIVDSPHVIGRYLNSLSWIKKVFGLPADADIVEAMKRHLFESLRIGKENGSGLAWNEEVTPMTQPSGAVTHNLREALLGLLGLAELAGCEEAIDRAGRLVRDIARYTRGRGRFPLGMLTSSGWQSFPNFDAAPAQSGRIVRSLLNYYRITGDLLALDTCYEIARFNAESCFAEDGTWKPEAGTHVHSITGTITSLIDLGIYLRDARLLQVGQSALTTGLKPYRSSFGWVKEMRNADYNRGEANNSGDVLESFILLAKNLDATYWDEAERILRNHLVASQLSNPEWFHSVTSKPDTETLVYTRAAERAIGGFCFSSPSDFKSHEQDTAPINTDLVGGATEALCESYASAVEDDGRNLRVNLLLSKSTPTCEVTSLIPEKGLVSVAVREPRSAWVRIPASAPRGSVRVFIDGEEENPAWVGSSICLCERPRRVTARVEFDLPRVQHTETINGIAYTSDWAGDTVLAVRGPKTLFHELY